MRHSLANAAEKPPEPVKVTYKEVIINGDRIMQRVEAWTK